LTLIFQLFNTMTANVIICEAGILANCPPGRRC